MTTDKSIDARQAQAFVANEFDESIIPALVDYIRIPNKSPEFDPDWAANGHMHDAMALIVDWCRAHPRTA